MTKGNKKRTMGDTSIVLGVINFYAVGTGENYLSDFRLFKRFSSLETFLAAEFL